MKLRKLVTILLTAILAVTTLVPMGCETTKGVGRDIEDAGEELDETF